MAKGGAADEDIPTNIAIVLWIVMLILFIFMVIEEVHKDQIYRLINHPNLRDINMDILNQYVEYIIISGDYLIEKSIFTFIQDNKRARAFEIHNDMRIYPLSKLYYIGFHSDSWRGRSNFKLVFTNEPITKKDHWDKWAFKLALKEEDIWDKVTLKSMKKKDHKKLIKYLKGKSTSVNIDYFA